MINPYDYYDPFMDTADEIIYPKIIEDSEDTRTILQDAQTIVHEIRCPKCKEWINEEETQSLSVELIYGGAHKYCESCKLEDRRLHSFPFTSRTRYEPNKNRR